MLLYCSLLFYPSNKEFETLLLQNSLLYIGYHQTWDIQGYMVSPDPIRMLP